MPRLESELSDAKVYTLIPNSIQNGRVYELDDNDGKGGIKKSKNGAPMCVLGWEIIGGEFTGRKIRFDNMMLGGMTKEGKPMPLGQFCQFLNYTGVPWKCLRCDTLHTEKYGFVIADKAMKDENPELVVGNYYCKECKHPNPKNGYDTADFMGAICGLSIGSKKEEGGDREFNTIRGYTDLRENP